jgi:hypothetical protein
LYPIDVLYIASAALLHGALFFALIIDVRTVFKGSYQKIDSIAEPAKLSL